MSAVAPALDPHVSETFLAWNGEFRWSSDPDDSDLDAAQRAADDARARLEAYLGDVDLQEAVGRDAYLAGARKRPEAADAALGALKRVKGEHRADKTRRYVLIDEWHNSWSHRMKAEALRLSLDSVYVRRGRGRWRSGR